MSVHQQKTKHFSYRSVAAATVLLATCWGNGLQPAAAQSGQESGPQDSAGGFALNVQRGNALQDLFTPKPQYVTPQTIMPPQPTPAQPGELNPLKGLFTPPQPFTTPQTVINPQAQPADGETNHLRSVFTPQPQYQTPQAIPNPEAVPRHLVPERELLWGSDERRASITREHLQNSFGFPSQQNLFPNKLGQRSGSAEKLPDHSRVSENVPHASVSRAQPNQRAEKAAAVPENNVHSADVNRTASTLRSALTQIDLGQPAAGLALLGPFLKAHPENAQAHYLTAVALVNTRRYGEAAAEYATVLSLESPTTQLYKLAQLGLSKLASSHE